MRGTLEPLAGVSAVDVTPGRKSVRVAYDPDLVSTAKMLAELEAAGETARVAD